MTEQYKKSVEQIKNTYKDTLKNLTENTNKQLKELHENSIISLKNYYRNMQEKIDREQPKDGERLIWLIINHQGYWKHDLVFNEKSKIIIIPRESSDKKFSIDENGQVREIIHYEKRTRFQEGEVIANIITDEPNIFRNSLGLKSYNQYMEEYIVEKPHVISLPQERLF
jgi:hypothetical protein